MKKKYRIRKNLEFQEIIHKSKKKTNPSFVCYYCDKKEEQSRVGISLSKKIGNAVIRNKIKRQVRMMCQEIIDFSLYQKDIVLIVRHQFLSLSYAQNKNNLEKILRNDTIK